jgi:NitT/TauT family transport system permease protein
MSVDVDVREAPGPDEAAVAPTSPASAGVASRTGARLWRGIWPKVIAVGLFVVVWQVVVLTGWRPDYALPGPAKVAGALGDIVGTEKFWQSLVTTLTRAAVGFAAAIALGTALGLAVSRSKVLRAGVGSLITGLQTMPSIVWFPLAILLFQLSEQAITFVVVLGAAPSIANGIISGIDHVPPAFTRLGRVLGARGWSLYRHVVVPAALPSYVAGLNQGWAFAWRSLMAGELLVVIPGATSLGSRLQYAQEFANAADLIAYMVVILVIGMTADWAFSSAARRMRVRRGLVD